jgi:hypothetical protein
MGADRDFAGRYITHAPHYSNCLLHALKQHGRLRLKMNGLIPHFSVETSEGTFEFVYGQFGRNALFPLWFKGYGVSR